MYWAYDGMCIFVCIYKRVITYAAYACRWFASPQTKKDMIHKHPPASYTLHSYLCFCLSDGLLKYAPTQAKLVSCFTFYCSIPQVVCCHLCVNTYTGPTSYRCLKARHRDNSDLFSCIKKQASMSMEVSNWVCKLVYNLLKWLITYLYRGFIGVITQLLSTSKTSQRQHWFWRSLPANMSPLDLRRLEIARQNIQSSLLAVAQC